MYDPCKGRNYFALLGIEKNFSLSLDILEKQYIDQQKRVHPDASLGRSELEQKEAFDQTALLNEAYETLKSPVRRGEHLLTLLNKNSSASLPLEVLEGILEKQEKLFSLEREEDIEKALSSLKAEERIVENKVAKTFERQAYEEAKRLLLELQYYERMQHHLEQKLV